MSGALIFACLWAIGCTIVAFLPMRYQYAPGTLLLVAFPFLLAMLGRAHGGWAVVVALIAAVSLFRKPLAHLARYIRAKLS
ncbi:DUF2484 family protein [Aliiroseovarius sp. PTFE2010]|uniref:DUF2484 family protein n=1 Tax=Aliiroseovarius sp. PTFE2010 TaxID=3417190 RepID=UPI003CED763E